MLTMSTETLDLSALHQAASELEERLSAALRAVEPQHGNYRMREALHRARAAQIKVGKIIGGLLERR